MDQSGFTKLSRRLSSKLLNFAVKPHLLGELPKQKNKTDAQAEPQTDSEARKKLTLYVLQNYSRSNAILLDNETKRLGLDRALYPLDFADVNEKKSVIY